MDTKAGGPPNGVTLAAFIGLVLIGGVNIVAVRFSNRELAPFFGAAARFIIASFLLFGYVIFRRLPLPRGQALVGTVIYAVVGFAGSYAFLYWALQTLSAGVGGIIMASVPLITVLLAVLHRVERFRPRALLGALLTILGIAVLVGGVENKVSLPIASLLAMLGAAACVAESGVIIKRFPPSHPASTNAVAMGIGAILLFLLSASVKEPWSTPRSTATWVSFVYLAGVGSLGLFGLYLFTLKRWTASGVSYMGVLVPIVAAVAGALLADEPFTWRMVAGGLIVLVGVYVGALSGQRKKGSPVAAPDGCVPAPEEAVA